MVRAPLVELRVWPPWLKVTAPASSAVEVSEVVPPEERPPPSVRTPPAVTSSSPVAVLAPRVRALLSARVTSLPEVTASVPKSLALFSVMLFVVPAAIVVVPEMVDAALSVTAPAVLRLKVAAVMAVTPSTVPRSTSSLSVKVTV